MEKNNYAMHPICRRNHTRQPQWKSTLKYYYYIAPFCCHDASIKKHLNYNEMDTPSLGPNTEKLLLFFVNECFLDWLSVRHTLFEFVTLTNRKRPNQADWSISLAYTLIAPHNNPRYYTDVWPIYGQTQIDWSMIIYGVTWDGEFNIF